MIDLASSSTTSSDRLLYREAASADAPQICALYEEEYRPADGGDARDHYPFPQFLEPDWVAEAVRRDTICWIVADLGGAVVGSAGAIRNIGSASDRVSEVFGIVVRKDARGHKIGSGMLAFLGSALGDEASILLCEARTGDPSAWKIARRCEFDPIGFEPFAHTTPVGSESMLLTARVRPETLARRQALPPVPPSVSALASAVPTRYRPIAGGFAQLSAEPLVAPHSEPRRTPGDEPASLGTRVGNGPHSVAPGEGKFRTRREDKRGSALLARWGDPLRHGSGVLGLCRLEGEDKRNQRYDRRFYIGSLDDRECSCVRVVWDRTDHRARILDLQSECRGLEGALIGGTVADLLREAGDDPLIIVIDVRADAPDLHQSLEKLAFIPTAYYPALIANGPFRIDAVQYSRLDHRPIDASLHSLEGLDWENAGSVITRVVQSARSNATSM